MKILKFEFIHTFTKRSSYYQNICRVYESLWKAILFYRTGNSIISNCSRESVSLDLDLNRSHSSLLLHVESSAIIYAIYNMDLVSNVLVHVD